MAEDDDKVKVELEMPANQVSVHSSAEPEGHGSSEGDDDGEDKKALDELKKTQRELRRTKKEVDELKEKVRDDEADEDDESTIKKATGYEASELIGAPARPPEPEAKAKPKLSQLRVILLGFLIVFIGLVLWPVFTFTVGLSLIIVGAVFVAAGVLLRV